MTEQPRNVKFKDVLRDPRASAAKVYRRVTYGDMPLHRAILTELILALFGTVPGAAGLWLRSKLYPGLFGAAGRKVIFGRGVVIRHPHKIRLGSRVVIEDGCVLDAKGEDNRGITIGDDVFVGRHTIVYCKNGDIELQDRVNISSNCQVASTNRLVVHPDTVVGAYSYLLSGGEYDYTDETPFSQQTGMNTSGPLEIGRDCWLGARVTVLDGASVGERCVIGAGAVVNRAIPPRSVAVGVPAKVVKSI